MMETQVQSSVGQVVPVPAPLLQRVTPAIGLRFRRRGKNLRTGEIAYLWFSRLLIWGFAALILVPAVWVLGASFQPGVTYTTSFFPTAFTWAHYQYLFSSTDFLLWVRNSVLICTTVGVATVLLVATMAYAFSRYRFPGRKYGLMSLLIIQMFPAQMSFVAFYYLLLQVNSVDTLYGYILVMIGGGLPFNAWLFKGYIDSLPRDLEEAAYVDGASKFQAYLRIILPLTRPMMAVIFIFVWFGLYSDFIISSFLLTTQNNFTVALGLYSLSQGQSFLINWTQFAAAAVVGSAPLLIVFLLAQRFLVAGLARGAVKG
ncbi:MAG TPA: sugar ABC transporter permease [Chloroflexota bacterium]|jgi:arabinogalactan oligomer/maltooligosaccharide transport system permease protein|nr:sugar ABC transporter permease [Chloroflexota bacterium]